MKPRTRIRAITKALVPSIVVRWFRTRRAQSRVVSDLALSADSPQWLTRSDLEALMKSYDYPAPYGYDSDSLAARGSKRANEIQALPHVSPVRTTLEFGCGDGMVSAALSAIGIRAIAADISDDRFDSRAREAGVHFHHCDAAGIAAIPDGAVDCVFSYNAFEHVQDPEAVLHEMSRIVRPGGLIFLSFGPLYYSAFGEHAYRSIPIPYCQFLFQIETMNQFCRDRGLDEIDPTT